MRKLAVGFSLLYFFNQVNSQSSLSGNFRLNTDFYDRDTAIGTFGPNYDYNKNSANAWLQTIYTNSDLGFQAGIRLEITTLSFKIRQTPSHSMGLAIGF